MHRDAVVEPDKSDIESILGVNKSRVRWQRIAFGLSILAVITAGGTYWAVKTKKGSGETYLTSPVSRGDLTVVVTATGTVEPTNLVAISSELSGTVREVLVDFNDTVEVGQVLARLNTDKLEASLAHARASLEARLARVSEVEATVNETQMQYERIKALAGQEHATQQALQAATAAHARADASLLVAKADAKVARADLQVAQTDLGKACICSPINGVVLDRNVDAGQIVTSSLQAPVLFSIAEDLTKMQLKVDIDEADVGVVRQGLTAHFLVEAYQDRRFPAIISELRYAPQTVDGVVTYQAILQVDNADMLLRPGMTATAEITVEKITDALLIPNGALRFSPPVAKDGDEQQGSGLLNLLLPRRTAQTPEPQDVLTSDGSRLVWVLRQDSPEAVMVHPGQSDGLFTVIPQGELSIGDKVITELAEK